MATNRDDLQTSGSNEIRGRPNKRPRMDRQIQKLGAVEQNRRAIRAETKQKAKEVDVSIANALIEWGSYSTDFPASSQGKKELYKFLQRLKSVSMFAKTRADATSWLFSKLRKGSKLEILAKVQSELLNLPQDDAILLTDAKSLQKALSQSFQVPLLHRATINHPSLAPSTNFGIQKLVEYLAQDKNATISVYDYSISDPNERTRQTTVDELLSHFNSKNACHTALNFLDIENRTGVRP